MLSRKAIGAALVASFVSPAAIRAQDVTYREDPNTGVTYKVTNQTIQRQIPVTQLQDSSRTVLRGQWKTETQSVVRTYSVPITEYHTESYWQNRFNPFVQPTLAYRQVPKTRWETRTEVVPVPVTRYETVPTTETFQVPVTTYHTVQDQVTHHQAVGVRPPNAAVMASRGSQQSASGFAQGNDSSGSDASTQATNSNSTTRMAR